ncbi:MAG: 7-cyano-7-deazaguanine synthase QueC [Candidatus Omnitrophota bacterium]
MEKAVVLLSGGMDSAVTLYFAKRKYDCRVLVFDYGQKAKKEIECAKKLAEAAGVKLDVLRIALPWKGSALVDEKTEVPQGKPAGDGSIPVTYVPARNMIFLSFAVSYAEAIGAAAVFIGAHQMDYSNYPDCRGEFFDAFREMVRLGTKTGTEGREVKIETPVINMTKKEILEAGNSMGVPFGLTWSCYKEGDKPCGKCESCLFRAQAFRDAGIMDPYGI